MSRRNQHIPMPEFAEHEASHSLEAMSAAWDRMARAALAKDNEGFDRARAEFWACAPVADRIGL